MTRPEEMVEYRTANHGDARGIAALHAENWRRAYRGNFRDEYLDSDVFSKRQSVWNSRLGHQWRTALTSDSKSSASEQKWT